MSRVLSPAFTKAGFPRLVLGLPSLDRALGGGLESGRLHEVMPAGVFHLGTALGFALGIAARRQRPGDILFVQQDFAGAEGGALYGLGCEIFGLTPTRLLLVRAAHAKDALWAMEEGLRCSGVSTVIAELGGQGRDADLTATRRLALAAQESSGLALLLRQQIQKNPSAAATRWRVASALSRGDEFGGLGPLAFHLVLTKNQRGPGGEWVVEWDRHAKCFISPAHSVAVAVPAFDRPARTAVARVG